MSEEVVKYEIAPQEQMRLGALQVSSPRNVIERATEIADELANLIRKKNLSMRIQGREYVRVEGWSVLGAMLGVIARERSTTRLEDGSYEAVVDLVRAIDGVIIGGASALCGTDEATWGKRPEFARRSMAITRATGKAFRIGFSWVMSMAGYEPTPAEEMDGVIVEAEVKPAPAEKKPAKQADAPISEAQAEFRARANALVKAGKVTIEQAQEYVEAAGGDYARALDMLNKDHG
jgi:hypothetical protein